MKKLILFIAVITLLTACYQPTKKYFVYATSDYSSLSPIECDSFTMVSQSHIIIYVDGIKSDIYASNIKIQSNQYYKKQHYLPESFIFIFKVYIDLVFSSDSGRFLTI